MPACIDRLERLLEEWRSERRSSTRLLLPGYVLADARDDGSCAAEADLFAVIQDMSEATFYPREIAAEIAHLREMTQWMRLPE